VPSLVTRDYRYRVVSGKTNSASTHASNQKNAMSKTKHCPGKRLLHQGFVAGYLLAAIALITASMTALSYMRKDSGQKLNQFNVVKAFQSQLSTIHSAITNCATIFPGGNNGTGFHKAYPPGTTPATVLSLNCPGSTYTNKNLWTGRDGAVPPLAPSGMTSWMYTNDATGVFVTSTNTNNDINLTNAMTAAAAHYVPNQILVAGNVIKYWIIKE
jgi:hypothetical protein